MQLRDKLHYEPKPMSGRLSQSITHAQWLKDLVHQGGNLTEEQLRQGGYWVPERVLVGENPSVPNGGKSSGGSVAKRQDWAGLACPPSLELIYAPFPLTAETPIG
jgi:hypothetical protein